MFDKEHLRISSIYVWFPEDFGGTPDGVLRHLRRYASGQLAEQLQRYTGKITHAYDWQLNAPQRAPTLVTRTTAHTIHEASYPPPGFQIEYARETPPSPPMRWRS
jgi:hypothetical protein